MPGFHAVLRLVPNEEVVEATLLGANLRDKEEKKQVWTKAERRWRLLLLLQEEGGGCLDHNR